MRFKKMDKILRLKKNIACIIWLFFGVFSSSYAADKPNPNTKQTPFLGVGYQVVETKQFKDSPDFGYHITRVLKDTAADVIGIEAEDIIISFDGQNLTGVSKNKRQQMLKNVIQTKKVGDEFSVTLIRIKTQIKNNGKTIATITNLKQLIDNQTAPSKLNLMIDKQITRLHLMAKLGVRQTLDKQQLPANNVLFPEYENTQTKWTKRIQQAIFDYKLTADYQDLLARYEQDELWDDGFRLNLFRYLHREPIKLTAIIDQRITELEQQLNQAGNTINALSAWIDEKPAAIDLVYPLGKQLKSHQNFISQILNHAKHQQTLAFSALTPMEINYIKTQMPLLLNRFSQSFYIDRPKHKTDKTHNIKLINLAKKINFEALLMSGQYLIALNNEAWLQRLNEALSKQSISFETQAGTVFIGHWGDDKHSKNYALMIDFGGNDIYLANSGTAFDKISMTIDYAGNDTYQHTQPYSQGSAFLGVGLLIDMAGDDTYIANKYAQGFALWGIGLLIDKGGNDTYQAQQLAQGTAFWGLGGVLDLSGDDNYRANLYAQGVGGTKAVGIIFDNSGNDHYFASGKDQSSYGTNGIFKGNSQGLGIGFRGYSSGGVGILLDAKGADKFQAGNFSGGVGYFYGLGILKNSGKEDDIYLSSRYSQGASAHSAIGILIDDGGNDQYHALMPVSQSAAWDIALASLWDKGGNDTYIGSNALSSHNGFSVFIDESGNDRYQHIRGGRINDYHGGVSFGFFIDGGGNDIYPPNYQNNEQTINQKYAIFLDGLY